MELAFPASHHTPIEEIWVLLVQGLHQANQHKCPSLVFSPLPGPLSCECPRMTAAGRAALRHGSKQASQHSPECTALPLALTRSALFLLHQSIKLSNTLSAVLRISSLLADTDLNLKQGCNPFPITLSSDMTAAVTCWGKSHSLTESPSNFLHSFWTQTTHLPCTPPTCWNYCLGWWVPVLIAPTSLWRTLNAIGCRTSSGRQPAARLWAQSASVVISPFAQLLTYHPFLALISIFPSLTNDFPCGLISHALLKSIWTESTALPSSKKCFPSKTGRGLIWQTCAAFSHSLGACCPAKWRVQRASARCLDC